MIPSFFSTQGADPIPSGASDLVFGIFLGVMLTASLYLFFIWVVIRDRGQVFMLLLLLCLGLNMASTNEIVINMLGLHNQVMINIVQNYSMILAYIFSVIFTYYFLEIDMHAPPFQIPLFILVGLLFMLLAYAAFDERPVHFLLPTLGAFTMIAILATGLYTLRQRVSGSLSHVVAFSFFLFGSLAEPLYDLGFFADKSSCKHFAYSAFAMATMMFAIVIAAQFAARQDEKERALAISNERFALAAKGSNEGLFDWNRATGEVFFSDQFRRILALPLDASNKGLKAWMKAIQSDDRRVVFEALRNFRDDPNAATINFEYRVLGRDQKRRWIHTKAVATRDPRNKRITRLVGSIGDATARKRSEAALRASEARFRSITEAHPVPVMIARLQDGHVLYASPGAEALLGLPSGTLISHRLDRFLTKNTERREILDSMMHGKEVNLKEVSITRGDGEVLPAAASARRINYQNEAAMVLGFYDLTERNQAQAEIAKQKQALQQSEKMAALGGLLAGVAHELNNPLSVVMGQTALLMEGANDEKSKTRAEKIFKAADRCSRIVKTFLALARRKEPERKAVNVNAIISASLELLGYQIRNGNVAVHLDLQEDLPAVRGDGDQLTQVFTNLSLNAAQALADWSGPRSLTIATRTGEEDHVRITVTDTGPGVPDELKVRVFEPFFTTKGTGGTGVGLSLCLNIIEGHGGHLALEDTNGGGATFVITLPTIVEEEGDQIGPAEKKESSRTKGLRLLLVDDEVELSQTLADLLEPRGHEIDLAANGEIALEKLRRRDFDAIISDLRMPVLDGPGLYEELARSMPAYCHKIIYVTGDTLSPNVQSFLSKTPVPVIEKPYRLADVEQALVKLLKENEGKSKIERADSPLGGST